MKYNAGTSMIIAKNRIEIGHDYVSYVPVI